MPPIPVGMHRSDWLFVELGQQDMCDRRMDTIRRIFKQVRKPDMQAAFAQSDGRIQAGKSAEPDIDGRHGCARTKRAILLFEDSD